LHICQDRNCPRSSRSKSTHRTSRPRSQAAMHRRGEATHRGQSSSRSPAAEASEDDANLNIGTCHPPRARVSGSRVDAPVAPTRTTCSTKSLVRVALELMATVVPVADGRPGRKGTGAEGPRRGGAGGRRPRAHVSFNSLAVKMVCRPFCDWPRVCSCRCVRFLLPCLLVPSACMCLT